MRNFKPYHSELAPSSHEDVGIDDQHGQQGHQHTAEEIEIDHVVQADHSFKQALRQAFTTGADAVCGGGVRTCITEDRGDLLSVLSFNNNNNVSFTAERILHIRKTFFIYSRQCEWFRFL